MHNYLIVKLSAIGDVIMALPMIRAIRDKDPDAHITWLCGTSVAGLLKHVEGIDALVTVDDKKLFSGGVFTRIGQVLSVWRKLGFQRFDGIFNGHGNAQYAVMTLLCRAAVKRKFSAKNRCGPLPGRHHSDEYVRLVTGIDGPEAPKAEMPAVTGLEDGVISRILGDVPRPMVLLAPGGAKNVLHSDGQKRWPVKSYAALADTLICQGFSVAIIGNSGDAYVREDFAGIPVLDLIGKTNFRDYMSVVREADVMVSHDTSALHMARLFATPLVGLFGPTMPGSFFYPYEKAVCISHSDKLPCAPCYDGKHFHDCHAKSCMHMITMEEVVIAIKSLQKGSTGSSPAENI